MSCEHCGKAADSLCSGCNKTLYCGEVCQKNDFGVHYKICGRVEDIRPDLAVVNVSQKAYNAAYNLLLTLKANKINVITAESLTAGKICATLVDIPTFGSYIYGGQIVYDTDAKRLLLNAISTGDVYTKEMAHEMAVNALKNSRATVAIAVTGKAGPAKEGTTDDALFDEVGTTHIGIAVRTTKAAWSAFVNSNNQGKVRNFKKEKDTSTDTVILSVVKFQDINAEQDGPASALIKKYRKDHKENGGKCPVGKECASLTVVSPLRDVIRWYMVEKACEYADKVIKSLGSDIFLDSQGTALKILSKKSYDTADGGYFDPSWIIQERMQ